MTFIACACVVGSSTVPKGENISKFRIPTEAKIYVFWS